jgi:hypothetical protein
VRYSFIVLTNSVEGRDDEYNKWYDDVHLDDVLAVPGFVAAQRFRRLDSDSTSPFGYVAIYEIETDDIDATMKSLTAAAGTDAMIISDAMDKKATMYAFESIGDRRTAPA